MESLSFAKVTELLLKVSRKGSNVVSYIVSVQVCDGSMEGELKVMKTSKQSGQLGG